MCKQLSHKLFWSPPTPHGYIWLFSSEMHHYVHQLVTNFICLFGAGHVVYSGFIGVFSMKLAACCCCKKKG